MKINYPLLIALIFHLGCSSNKVEISKHQDENSKTTATPAVESPTKFGLSRDVISKIDNEMDLGKLLSWQNDAEPGSEPDYFTTLEYEVKSSNESLIISNNVIELSIGSKGATGKYVDFVRITVGFMNPEDEANAKKLYVQKVNQLSKVLAIEIPSEVHKAIKEEKNFKIKSNKYEFEVEIYGATRKWMTLHIK